MAFLTTLKNGLKISKWVKFWVRLLTTARLMPKVSNMKMCQNGIGGKNE